MGRTIIVGDLHACIDELEALLAHVGFSRRDRLVLVGDLVVRGPAPRATLDLLLDVGARAVRGNHEDRLLKMRDGEMPVGTHQRATMNALKRRHWEFIESLPLWLDLEEHGVRVVHAGVVPGLPIDKQRPRTLMYIRAVAPDGEPIEKRTEPVWGRLYEGPPHVVFGHNAQPEPQIHNWATGLDTGCVYGGRLTAMVLREGERPPPLASRRSALVSIPARRAYASS